jgi:hypothetical protein
VANAKLTLPDGTTVNIEGNADEVATLLTRFTGSGAEPVRKPRAATKPRASAKSPAMNRKGPTTLIAGLAADGFFKSRRTIGQVQAKLEEGGHIYPLTALSTPLLRLTRTKVLRRLKEKAGWVYVS